MLARLRFSYIATHTTHLQRYSQTVLAADDIWSTQLSNRRARGRLAPRANAGLETRAPGERAAARYRGSGGPRLRVPRQPQAP